MAVPDFNLLEIDDGVPVPRDGTSLAERLELAEARVALAASQIAAAKAKTKAAEAELVAARGRLREQAGLIAELRLVAAAIRQPQAPERYPSTINAVMHPPVLIAIRLWDESEAAVEMTAPNPYAPYKP